LFGDFDDKEFNRDFCEYALNTDRNEEEWMQAFPRDWDKVLSDLFDEIKGSRIQFVL